MSDDNVNICAPQAGLPYHCHMNKKRASTPVSITLHDVARAAGVSVMTVSRALSKPEMVSAETLEKVQRATALTGYIPNRLAGGLKSKRSMIIGALVPYIAVPQFLPTIQTLTEELTQVGYQLIFGQTGYDHSREPELLEALLSRRVDGIVVFGLLSQMQGTERFRKLGIPVVETWDLSDRPVDMLVGFSQMKVGSAVADFCKARGWTHAGIASASDNRASRRRQGFVASFGREVPTAIVPAPSTLESGRHALRELLAQDDKLQVVMCSSDGMAQGVHTEAKARGLRIPEDLAIIGFGDAEFAAHLDPSLTSVRVDSPAIGRIAAQKILKRCSGEEVEELVTDVGFAIMERGST